MSGTASRLRTEAVVVERAALEVQYAGLAGARSDPAIIGALQLASDSLRYAAERLEPPPVASVRTMAVSVTMTGVWVVSVVATLLTVPHPTRPWVPAVALAGGSLLAMLIGQAVKAVWDRHAIRARALAPAEPVNVPDTIAQARTRIAIITVTLEPERNDAHLEVGRRIESSLVWLDAAERAAERSER